ncbi:lipopolysaccharide biosynthesis protein [Serinicoccus sp. CUA-874]|uniref:lipopolysaccharide biosynthesis protein n=1 Tax=Serinicoccus sp. CUA-874 TaxID=1517939 RepID=UPI0009FA0D9C|nr:polysaccharide biosynthesis C-terminal domain-containing protein [Serinicoccus sp. CUA-874]
MTGVDSPHVTKPGTSGAGGSSLRRAGRGSMLNFAGSAVSAVSTFVLTVLITRLSSTTEAGAFFTATSVFLLAAGLAQLGTNAGLVYFLSGSRARGELSRAHVYMRIAAVPVLIASVVCAAVLIIWSGEIGRLLSPDQPERFATFVVAMALFLPAAGITNLTVSASRGLGTMAVNATLDQLARPLLQLGLVALAFAVLGVDAAPWAWSASYVPLAVLGWWWWRRLRDRAATQDRSAGFAPWGAFWRFSSPRAAAGLAQVAMQRFDIVLVGALAGLPAAAIYTAATRFITLGQAAARAVGLSVQPHIGEAVARSDWSGTSSLYRTATGWLIVITWPLYLMLMTFSGTVLRIFGGDYTEGQRVLQVLCAAMLVATACGMVDMVLLMAGKSLWNLGNVILALTTNVVIDLLLIPRLGIVGAAIGWAVAILVGNLVPLMQLLIWRNLHPFGRESLLAMALPAVVFGGLPAGLAALVDDQGYALLISLAVCSPIYLLGLWFLRRRLQLGYLVTSLRRRRGGRGQAAASAQGQEPS